MSIDHTILEQVIEATAEPLIIVRVDRPDWPVALCNQAFQSIRGEDTLNQPFADVIEQLVEKTQAQHIVVSIGSKGVVGWDGRHFMHQTAYETTIIDALGAGDALAAGVIHGWLDGSFVRG